LAIDDERNKVSIDTTSDMLCIDLPIVTTSFDDPKNTPCKACDKTDVSEVQSVIADEVIPTCKDGENIERAVMSNVISACARLFFVDMTEGKSKENTNDSEDT